VPQARRARLARLVAARMMRRAKKRTWRSEQRALRLRGPYAQVDTLVRLYWRRSLKMKSCSCQCAPPGKSADLLLNTFMLFASSSITPQMRVLSAPLRYSLLQAPS
jgi:hypothetical protein